MDHRAVPGRMADMPPGAQGANPYVRPAMQRHTSGLRLVSEDRERIVRKDQMCVKCSTASPASLFVRFQGYIISTVLLVQIAVAMSRPSFFQPRQTWCWLRAVVTSFHCVKRTIFDAWTCYVPDAGMLYVEATLRL